LRRRREAALNDDALGVIRPKARMNTVPRVQCIDNLHVDVAAPGFHPAGLESDAAAGVAFWCACSWSSHEIMPNAQKQTAIRLRIGYGVKMVVIQ